MLNARDAVLERSIEAEPGYRPTIRIGVEPCLHDGVPGVCIVVEDNGTGMSDEVMQRAFDPFFTTKEADRGTGLGLAIVGSILSAHNGTVDVSTTPGQGTRITLWLPAYQPEDAALTPEAAPQSEGAGMTTSPVSARIMIVDDEELIGEIAQAYLSMEGYDAFFVLGGQAAIDRLAAGGFDLVLLDLNMPAPDGWEVLAAVRRVQPGTPVIIASGFADAAEVLQRGAVALIHKPYTREQLAEAVRTALVPRS